MFLLLKTQKTTSSASVWWGNTKSSFTENARTFSKSSTTQENIKKNLQNELYQLENKQAKGAKLRVNIRQEGGKGSKTFFRVLERHNMPIQTIFELHTEDNKSKYSKDILKSAKTIMKNPTPGKLPQLLLLNFLAKFLT